MITITLQEELEQLKQLFLKQDFFDEPLLLRIRELQRKVKANEQYRHRITASV